MLYKENKNKNAHKNVIIIMSQESLNPKIRFLGQNMYHVARSRIDSHTCRQRDY